MIPNHSEVSRHWWAKHGHVVGIHDHECSCLTSPSDLRFTMSTMTWRVCHHRNRSLCSKYGTLSCRKLDWFEPEGIPTMSATSSTARHKYANHSKLKLTILAYAHNQMQWKESETSPSACKWIVVYMVIAWLLHLLQVNWGRPQWILRCSCHAEHLPKVSQSYQTSGTNQTAITSSHWR